MNIYDEMYNLLVPVIKDEFQRYVSDVNSDYAENAASSILGAMNLLSDDVFLKLLQFWWVDGRFYSAEYRRDLINSTINSAKLKELELQVDDILYK